MRWITDETEFTEIFLRARTCVYIDSGREPTALTKLTFDDAQICTYEFSDLLQRLMEHSNDTQIYYIILDPDPQYYFYQRFKKYPAFEIVRGDSRNDYIAMLNEDPGDSPIDAVGTNWWACVTAPPSLQWFAHALRSDQDDGGHLWVPPEWVTELRGIHPYLNHAHSV